MTAYSHVHLVPVLQQAFRKAVALKITRSAVALEDTQPKLTWNTSIVRGWMPSACPAGTFDGL